MVVAKSEKWKERKCSCHCIFSFLRSQRVSLARVDAASSYANRQYQYFSHAKNAQAVG
jgi:hypothetical protein